MCEGKLKLDGNQLESVMVEACLTVRLTSQAETKVGHSDPGVLGGKALDQRIKGTGLERRETVRSLSSARVGNLRRPIPSTRGPGWTNLWCVSCPAKGIAE